MIMISVNVTKVKDFIILGIPGLLPEYYGLASFVFLVVYIIILFGNIFILAVIIFERVLHKPSYLIFAHLAMTDVIFGTLTIPKIIARYWWNDMITPFTTCFAQMFFVHSLGAIHSFILLVMALDRFVAVWFPLRYPAVITNKTTSIACSLCWTLTFIRMMGIVLHASSLSFCDIRVSQCYCDHASVTKLACGENVAFVQEVAFANAMVTLLFPLSFIIFSYFSIIIAVLKMSNTEGYRKVLSTCAPQILTTCLYYVPRCVVYITDNLKVKVSPDARIIIALLYSLIPAAVNPLIYCLKTADIKAALIKRFKSRKINMALKSNTKQGHKY
ncbi:Olfactory receptor 1E1 [Oryzias melastigma]|uniref:Olfactory receptor 1E1 n=1 Tax=Oryzias melastigma TaxID=30732 RepID=A0A834FBI9_ORYME|nr:olfactory receptor 2AT4 [Oryzias melastigma]KAF6724877.1 Olfactory receptor 1E1 [Oryzias melastigma]